MDAVQSKNISFLSCTEDGVLALKHLEKFYYQLQVAIHCTGRKLCDFVVRTCQDISMEHIEYNETFCNFFSC